MQIWTNSPNTSQLRFKWIRWSKETNCTLTPRYTLNHRKSGNAQTKQKDFYNLLQASTGTYIPSIEEVTTQTKKKHTYVHEIINNTMKHVLQTSFLFRSNYANGKLLFHYTKNSSLITEIWSKQKNKHVLHWSCCAFGLLPPDKFAIRICFTTWT